MMRAEGGRAGSTLAAEAWRLFSHPLGAMKVVTLSPCGKVGDTFIEWGWEAPLRALSGLDLAPFYPLSTPAAFQLSTLRQLPVHLWGRRCLRNPAPRFGWEMHVARHHRGVVLCPADLCLDSAWAWDPLPSADFGASTWGTEDGRK